MEESYRKCHSRVGSLWRYLEKRNVEGQQSFVIDSTEILERFLAEAIGSVIFGSNCTEVDFVRVEKIVKSIDRDLSSLNGSLRLLLSSCMPKRFRTKVFQKDVDDFFTEIVLQKQSGLIEKLSAELNNNEPQLATAQILIFIAGGLVMSFE